MDKLEPIPYDVPNAMMGLVARAQSGEYGDVPPDIMRDIGEIQKAAIEMKASIKYMNDAIGLIKLLPSLAGIELPQSDLDELASAVRENTSNLSDAKHTIDAMEFVLVKICAKNRKEPE